jgi:glyceraldehyde 3-phosphate dehydrogenase
VPAVAINGLGRIGRAALKILLDSDGLDVVAVNDIADARNLANLLKYDTIYGRYQREVSAEDGALIVDGQRIAALPSVTRGTCRGAISGPTWCWSAPGSSPARRT